jgi:HD-GYP domain-containing protein (c-di-GMP phosphodiesterase class II)
MKKVSLGQLAANTYIDAPVYLDEKFILFSPEIPISSQLIERLKKWNFEKVFTNGMPSDVPPTQTAGNAVAGGSILDQDIKEKEAGKKALHFFQHITTQMNQIFADFQMKGEFFPNPVIDISKEVMEEVRQNKHALLSIQPPEPEGVFYIVPHAVKTAVFALAIADFFRLPPHRQIDIGTTALLHEIGMLKIPPEIYQHDRSLTDKERKTIIAHPVLSYRILKEVGFPATVCLGVLEHHEYVDGSGYPRKLTGPNISLYGKIVGLASAYAAATSRRPFREEHDGHTSIMDLVKEMGTRYDERVLRALIFTLSVFPIGTYVRLTNGALGLVVKTDPREPKHPIVRLLVNEKNVPYRDRPVVQPKDGDEVRIERPLSKEETAELKKTLSS